MRFERHSDYLHTHHSQSATKENKQVEQTKPRIDTHCLVLDSLSRSLSSTIVSSRVSKEEEKTLTAVLYTFFFFQAFSRSILYSYCIRLCA